jgi:putative inorganic carbon (HCO3(-)) transporter
MNNLYVALIYLSFFVVGVTTPFVLTLGYVWVDVFYPQIMSTLVDMLPASMIVAIAAMLTYVLLDRRSPPRFSVHTAITLMFAVWVTLSLSWAEVPDFAFLKWDWAVKTIVFSTFLPLVFRTRVQIEAFLQVFLFALTLHMLPRGVKDLLSGSGYGRNLGIINSNILLLESSTLAMVSIAMIPIILYLRAHSVLIPKSRLRDLGGYGMLAVAVACAISTYARTALVGFIVVGVFMFIQSRRKILFAVCAVIMAIGFSAITANSWDKRIDTTVDYDQDDSALGRILVWEWTLAYSFQHPFGGGFDAYRIDHIEFPATPGYPAHMVYGKAYHNMYFEVLGEQGYPGLAMFVSLQLLSLGYLFSVSRRTRGKPYLLWLHDLANAGMTSLLVLMACGCFIGVGFQAQLWYFLALPICLREYLHRVELLESKAPQAAAERGRGGALMPLPRPAR